MVCHRIVLVSIAYTLSGTQRTIRARSPRARATRTCTLSSVRQRQRPLDLQQWWGLHLAWDIPLPWCILHC